jgi:hypothetical protein
VINVRKKRKESTKKTGIGRMLLLLFIVIPLLGIVIGYGVSKTIIIPYLAENQDDTTGGLTEGTGQGTAQPPADTTETTSEEENQTTNAYQRVFNVEGLELYRIQVGAFSSQENALDLAEELNNKGMAASMDTEGLIKVYAFYSLSMNEAVAYLEQIREHYSDAHVLHIGYPSVDISLADLSSEQAGLISEQLRVCKGMITEITAKDVSGIDISDTVQEHKSRIEKFNTEVSQTSWPASAEKLVDEVSMLYTAMLESYSEYNHQTGIPGQISMELINCYVGFLKRISVMI